MKTSFRWHGFSDPVSLANIAQIPGMQGIVSALYDIQPGELWKKEAIEEVRDAIVEQGLEFVVVESLNVHEDIKLGLETRDELIDTYCRSLENIKAVGIPVVCYNFMPVIDWLRTDLNRTLPDGSTSLAFDPIALESNAARQTMAGLPGWGHHADRESLDGLLVKFRALGIEGIWDNYGYFLERVIPVAAQLGLRMAIHPADPPWPVLGVPRLITDEVSIARALDIIDDPTHGLTFCTGSLGANPDNDLPHMIRRFGSRIHFAHCRNVAVTGHQTFHETAHPSPYGDVDMLRVMKAYRDIAFEGPMRPDHGRMIWNENGQPGYGLYDRALGAVYLVGLWEGIS